MNSIHLSKVSFFSITMKGRQNFLLFTTCVLLFLAVDAGYLRGLAEKVCFLFIS